MKAKTYIVPAVAVEQIVSKSLMNPASSTILQNGGNASEIPGDWTIS